MKPVFRTVGQPTRFVLRETECIQPGVAIGVTATCYGSSDTAIVRVHQSVARSGSGAISISQEIPADLARALAAELIACADAIDARGQQE